MTRNEKIRLIKGYLLGIVTQSDLKPKEIEVWFKQMGTDYFRSTTNPAAIIDQYVADSFAADDSIIVVDFIAGNTIL